ncbi:putative regulatory protein embR [Actinoplanes sp. SE50]|uniref:AfsR/SARP family transcriptional regulator n=1 Tax=unclassified Actinoplanes TaxID=2626549 RepID=UPI00023EC16C|nr:MULTISPECIES: AfsR/SARP family transcriptional regulator [unclassified Actinoplanes]AEV86959.1 putative regulatory protein embR [Actinoplanes sp. SE50/110]ATO85355.1 putative regulatory protein embR [Actinoplanes sp. SE50]SLM02767.1 SARP family transcriptional regulator [Actinoplanes sp. SE50/110]
MSTLVTTVARPAGVRQVRYGVLGRFRVGTGPDEIDPGPHKMRLLLALLLIRAGQVATPEQLIDDIWGADPPRRAVAALQVYISRLRKVLRPADGDLSIATQKNGYLVTLDMGEVDHHVFQSLLAQGRTLAREGRHAAAVTVLEEALALWRGTPLDGLHDSARVRAFATWLQELRLECHELLIGSGLALGRHRDLVGRLYGLTAEQPLREAFRHQLMIALYRSDRRADALLVFQDARAVLREQVGVEPGRALADLHFAILNGDEQLYRGLRGERR